MNAIEVEARKATLLAEEQNEPATQEWVASNEWSGVMARLAAAWAWQFGLDAAHVKPDAKLVADMNFDDIDHIDALMAAEDEFDLVIEDADAAQCVTVADYVALIQRLLGTPAHAGFES